MKKQIQILVKGLSLFSCMIFLLAVSCKKQDSKEDSQTSVTKNNSKPILSNPSRTTSSVDITTLSNSIKLTYNSDLSLFNWSNPNFETTSLPILRLWQKRYGCQHLGVCGLFPKPIPRLDEEQFMVSANQNPGRIIPAYLQIDPLTNNFKPLVFYVTDDVSSMPAEATDFVVDEDMVLEINYLGYKNLTIPAATYHIDNSLGSFGGYKVNLVGSN